MTKRQLDSKYIDLADWVKQVKHSDDGTSHSLALILSCIYDFRNEGKISDILNDLNEDLTLISSNDLIPIITDIYNDNYELEEPLYYWRLKMSGLRGGNLYVFKFIAPNGVIGITPKYDEADKLAKNELIEMLANTDTNLTIDNFYLVEEL
jgi:hypothetical protein